MAVTLLNFSEKAKLRHGGYSRFHIAYLISSVPRVRIGGIWKGGAEQDFADIAHQSHVGEENLGHKIGGRALPHGSRNFGRGGGQET